METAQQELPRYKSHKTVWALKISSISPYAIPNGPDAWRIYPEEPGYDPVVVSNEWKQKHQPQIGGYWVLYKDGYTSYSPAEAFEEGNTRDIGELVPVLLKEASLTQLANEIAIRAKEIELANNKQIN